MAKRSSCRVIAKIEQTRERKREKEREREREMLGKNEKRGCNHAMREACSSSSVCYRFDYPRHATVVYTRSHLKLRHSASVDCLRYFAMASETPETSYSICRMAFCRRELIKFPAETALMLLPRLSRSFFDFPYRLCPFTYARSHLNFSLSQFIPLLYPRFHN